MIDIKAAATSLKTAYPGTGSIPDSLTEAQDLVGDLNGKWDSVVRDLDDGDHSRKVRSIGHKIEDLEAEISRLAREL